MYSQHTTIASSVLTNALSMVYSMIQVLPSVLTHIAGSNISNVCSLTEVIGNLLLCMTEGITRFIVRRGHVLEDALQATSQKNFDPHKQLKVSCGLISVYSNVESLDKLMS